MKCKRGFQNRLWSIRHVGYQETWAVRGRGSGFYDAEPMSTKRCGGSVCGLKSGAAVGTEEHEESREVSMQQAVGCVLLWNNAVTRIWYSKVVQSRKTFL